VRAFGADHIVDCTAATIAEAVKDPVDVVVNLVAGSREDTEALLDVTKPGGVLVSATSPGVLAHPATGDTALALVTVGSIKLANLRARPQITATFRRPRRPGPGGPGPTRAPPARNAA
jgi:NADPH:quinone reductase-like Zn-dependent oxidoreductase